jgi:hypothetical protein
MTINIYDIDYYLFTPFYSVEAYIPQNSIYMKMEVGKLSKKNKDCEVGPGK